MLGDGRQVGQHSSPRSHVKRHPAKHQSPGWQQPSGITAALADNSNVPDDGNVLNDRTVPDDSTVLNDRNVPDNSNIPDDSNVPDNVG